MNVGIGTNAARMKRQQTYLAQLSNQLDGRIQEDKAYTGLLYDELAPYLQTSMSRGLLINKAWAARNYERTTWELAGTHQIGNDGFMQFYADESELQKVVLELFYQKVK